MKQPKDINVLIGCEESQAVCIEFRKLGFNAFSCDLLECSGGHPEWHITEDIFIVINSFRFYTQDRVETYVKKWHCLIAFPPCTFLTVTANKWMKPEFEQRFPTRKQDRVDAINFFMDLYNCGIKYIVLENPIGVMSTSFRKPDQIIQPYYFGDPDPKSTCLWLKNLPKLIHIKEKDLFNNNITHVEPEFIIGKRNGKKYSKTHYMSVGKGDRALLRSKTYPGIAKTMSLQWGEYLLK